MGQKIVQVLHLRLRGMGKASPAGVTTFPPQVLMLGWPPQKEYRPMLKKSGFIFLLAHGMAAMAQTVSGNVFCAGMTFDSAPASVSISGTVAAADAGLPGAIWVGIEDPLRPGYPAAFLTPTGWAAWTTGGFPIYVETPAMGSTFCTRRVSQAPPLAVAVPQQVPILLGGKSMRTMVF